MISSLIGGGLTVDQSERTALLRASSLLPRGRGDTRGVHRGHGDSAERCCEGVHRGTGTLQRDVVRGYSGGTGTLQRDVVRGYTGAWCLCREML